MSSGASAANSLAGFIYTAASDNMPAFRIGIPLSQPVDGPTYTRTWQAMNRLFGCAADWRRSGAESLFRVPGCIAGREARLFVASGDIHSAEEWIDEIGQHEQATLF